MSSRWARFARGWFAAVFATATAGASHTIGGATTPAPAILALGVVFAAIVCIVLAGKTLSLVRLTAAVLISQLAFHILFLVAPSSPMTVTSADASAGGVHAHAHSFTITSAGSAGQEHAAHGSAMWFAHAAAAVLTIVAIRHGEVALRRVIDLARTVVIRAVRVVIGTIDRDVVGRLHGIRPVFRTIRPLTALDVVLSALRHRGPPVLVAA